MTTNSIPEIYQLRSNQTPEKVAVMWRRAGYPFRDITYKMLWEDITRLASGLIELGLQKRSKLCIWSSNRPEWLTADIACQLIGVPTIPIYTTLSAKEISYILKDSSCRILIVENSKMLNLLEAYLDQLDQLWGVVVLDGDLTHSISTTNIQFFNYKDLILTPPSPHISTYMENIQSTDIASIIYTSGTTGFPKGVLLSHHNFICNIEEIPPCLPITSEDRHLSFLPLSHVFERTCGSFLMGFSGATIIYANGVDGILEDAKKYKPTFLMAVPRFYEKVMAAIEAKIVSSSNVKKKLLRFAKKVSFNHHLSRNPSLLNRIQFQLLRILVFKKFNHALGGALRFGVSGGAPLRKEIGEFFLGIGIQLLEGYGLTETSPVIALNRIDNFKFGSVGIPLSIANVRISNEGEIITSGPCVMKGYHNRVAETNEVIKDTVFHTGDLGKLDEDGFLWITGRKKDLIVLSGGKKVCPTSIENIIESNIHITRCVLYGESKNYLTALIVPNFISIFKLTPDWERRSKEDLCLEPLLNDFIRKELEVSQSSLARFECIKKFLLIPDDFSIESGDLTPTLKLKRNIIWGKYSSALNALYE